MGRIYTAVFEGVAVTAQQDFFAVQCTASVPVRLISCRIGQSSDAGDAQDEMLRIRIQRGMTSDGSGGGTVTPRPVDVLVGGTAASTVRINDTTPASGGTIHVLLADVFNVRAGWIYMPVPEERIVCAVSTRIAIGLLTTPADSLTMSGALAFEEI